MLGATSDLPANISRYLNASTKVAGNDQNRGALQMCATTSTQPVFYCRLRNLVAHSADMRARLNRRPEPRGTKHDDY